MSLQKSISKSTFSNQYHRPRRSRKTRRITTIPIKRRALSSNLWKQQKTSTSPPPFKISLQKSTSKKPSFQKLVQKKVVKRPPVPTKPLPAIPTLTKKASKKSQDQYHTPPLLINVKKKTKASELDQYYTEPDLVDKILKSFYSLPQSKNCRYTIEPSAGRGDILDKMKEPKIGFDLDPKRQDIIKMNFLSGKWKQSIPKGMENNVCFLGNPPFGIATKFINKAAEANPRLIAFILPLRFLSAKGRTTLHKNYHLIYADEIYCCYNYLGTRVQIPTVFMVWERREMKCIPYQNSTTEDFVFIRSEKDKQNALHSKNDYIFIFSKGFISNGMNDKIAHDYKSIKTVISKMKFRSQKTKKYYIQYWNVVKVSEKISPKYILTLFNSKPLSYYQRFMSCRISESADLSARKRFLLNQKDTVDIYNALKSKTRSIMQYPYYPQDPPLSVIKQAISQSNSRWTKDKKRWFKREFENDTKNATLLRTAVKEYRRTNEAVKLFDTIDRIYAKHS